MIVVGVVEAVTRAKEKGRNDEDRCERQQNYFDIHRINRFVCNLHV